MTKPIDELISAFLESAEELKNRITDVENALDRQGVKEMKPGLLVDKDFCHTEHEDLIKSMKDLFDGFTKGISLRVYGTWAVLVIILGGMSWAIKGNAVFIHELTKVVFK